jgi:glutamine amidotransferase-like uncharacterized protein
MPSSKHHHLQSDILAPYRTINMLSAVNEDAVVNGSPKQYPYPAIGIYNGHGASHSWLWFVEILDSMGFWDIHFIDEGDIHRGALARLNVLLISGGDTFAIAEALGETGAQELKSFLKHGGLYIGSCAGAYLPLNSSLSPLNLFNMASVKISNLTKNLPEPVALPEKFCTAYGCSYVFHPVREEVTIRLDDAIFPQRSRELTAPLYGGPSLIPSQDATTLARYTGFTDKTLFLTSEQVAGDTLIGKSALVHKNIGHGNLYLLGPHLEHPHFPEANTLIADLIYKSAVQSRTTPPFSTPPHLSLRDTVKPHPLVRDIKSQVSNARIVALSLERNQVTWMIGHKIYEPAKIRVFLETIWQRFSVLENSCFSVDEDLLIGLKSSFQDITRLIRKIKVMTDGGAETTDYASQLFIKIKASCAHFLILYFTIKRSSLSLHHHSIN